MDFTATSLPCSKGGVSTDSTGVPSSVSLGRYGGGLGTLTSSSLACSKGELGIDYSAVQDGVNSLVCYTGEQGSKSQHNKGVYQQMLFHLFPGLKILLSVSQRV